MNGSHESSNTDRRVPTTTDPSPLQRAISALEKMKARLDAVERAANEPIAIVGVGCRFPGGGDGPDGFWQLLDQGVDAVREIPPERRRMNAARGTTRDPRWAALLDDISGFDAHFFRISPREAESLDPQQRMLLEVAWEALEDGGQRPDLLFGTRTGVFIGLFSLDYRQLVMDRRAEQFDAYCTTGNLLCTAAGRISFTLGFQGPALSIETGCSSSLVCIAQACQSLHARDSDLALAGGVNALLSATMMAMVAETQALSPDGRCKTLDARANGFVRGEGCGLVVLKRLSDALRDGDRIRGLIRGWAVNQDGRSTGLTAPNVLSQQAMLRQALERARLSPADIDYVELHGTGTSLGDPIEAEALRHVFGAPRDDGSTCVLGAVKTNIGHLEGAAGAASIIKVLLSLEHERIPKNLHFRRLNPRISLDGTPLVVPTEAVPWPRATRPRRAGVNAFGIGGTNAHIILEEPPRESETRVVHEASSYLLPLSAKTPAALIKLAQSYADWFARTDASLHDVTYTASVRHMHHEHRLAIVAQRREECVTILSEIGRGELPAHAMGNPSQVQDKPKIVFVFPGQGSQWLGMGRQLLEQEPIFRSAIEKCDAAIRTEAGFSVLEELAAKETESRLLEIDVVQPMLFAIAIGLVALWRSWGIEPDCVVGHSMGEVAAAHVAGILNLEDATRVICQRSRLLKRISGRGAMALVELTMADATRAIEGFESRLGVAVSNGPRSTVLSGDPAALEEVLAALERKSIFCRRIKVDVASHSPQVDGLRPDLLDVLRDIRPAMGNTPLHSTVRGGVLSGSEAVATYWWDNLRQPVRFSQVMQSLMRDGFDIFVEMSPHPILLPSITENLKAASVEGAAIASMRRQTDERHTMLEALGALYMRGHAIDWEKQYRERGRVVSLPTYPWQHEKFWVDMPVNATERRATGHHEHPLLGSRVRSSIAVDTLIWQAEWSLDDLPYLVDHRMMDQIIVPGSAYIEAALFASRTQLGEAPILLENIAFLKPLILRPEEVTLIEVTLSPNKDGSWNFRFSSYHGAVEAAAGAPSAAWTLHATATVRRNDIESSATESLSQLRQKCSDRVSAIDQLGASYGLQIGPAFQGLREVWQTDGEVLGLVGLPEEVKSLSSEYLVHPALLDAAIRILAVAPKNNPDDGPRVLSTIDRLLFRRRAGDSVWSHSHETHGVSGVRTSITLFDDAGTALLSLEGLQTQKISRLGAFEDPHADLFLAQQWQSTEPLAIPQKISGSWLVLSDDEGIGDQVCALLRERGAEVTTVKARRPRLHAESTWREVNPGAPDEVAALITEMLSRPQPPQHIVYCWGITSSDKAELTADMLDANQLNGCGGALHVVQALLRTGARHMPRLWLITRGTQAIADAPSNVEITQAPLWGLGRTIAIECPELRCARIDLDPTGGHEQLELLLHELAANDEEEEIAFRRLRRFVGRLVKPQFTHEPPANIPVFPDASYLITGGLGGLGLLAAKSLASAGARHLILMGRQGVATPAQEDAIATIKSLGVEVFVAQANVANAQDLAGVLRYVDEHMPPLRGIVHTAGVLEDGTLPGQTIARFRRVFEPKIIGTWNLHVQTQQRPIDFFILYSALAALLGWPGLGNYVAANTFLDVFAHYRRSRNLAATSINWGLTTDTGMASKAQTAGRITEHGIGGMTPATTEALLLRVLREQWTQMGIADVNFRTWRERHPQVAVLRRYALLERSVPSPTKQKNVSFLATLEKAKPDDRVLMLENFVREQLAAVLRSDSERIGRLAPLRHLGIDSLMSLELRNRLETALGLKLSATLVWSYPHVAAIAEYLVTVIPLSSNVLENEPAPVAQPSPTMTDEKGASVEDDLLRAFDESMTRARIRRKS